MALTPRFAAQAISSGPFTQTTNTIELYLDYVCPFSAKMWKTLSGQVLPDISKRYPSKVRFILRQQIQPWHPSSTLVHEAAAAVLQVKPDKFKDFSDALFERQKEYFDVGVVHETRNQTYGRLAKLAAEVGVDEEKVLKLLKISDKPGEDGSLNSGNGVTNDIKWMVKTNRLTGVHVTPTVLFNGAVENGVGSSTSGEEWLQWLDKSLV